MFAHDLVHNILETPVFPPASYAANITGAIIDTLGFQRLMFIVQAGTLATATAGDAMTFSFQEGDMPNMSDAVDVTVGTVAGAYGPTYGGNLLGAAPVFNNVSQANSAQRCEVITNSRRYVRIIGTKTGAFSGFLAGLAILGSPTSAPTALP